MLQKVQCAIRNTGSGWHILNDDDHQPIGVSSIYKDQYDFLVLVYSFTATKVHSMVVQPDEYYGCVNQHIAGVSVGLSQAYIALAKTGVDGMVDPDTLTYANGNFWVMGEFTV